MKTFINTRTLSRTLAVSLFASAAFAGASAHAYPFTGASADYGQIVSTSAVDKTIQVDASTRWANVTDGQTVRFDVDGKSFTFNFSGWPGAHAVDLAKIAPQDIAVPHILVYIAANPRYNT
jgi:hypothetical protein